MSKRSSKLGRNSTETLTMETSTMEEAPEKLNHDFDNAEVEGEFASTAGFVHSPRNESHAPSLLHTQQDFENVVSELRETFDSNETLPIPNRIKVLKSVLTMIKKTRKKITKAIDEEFKRQPGFTEFSEINLILREANVMIKNVKKWSKKQRQTESVLTYPSWSYTRYEPKGVVLIIGAWNFPFNLTIVPMLNAIAAGNVVLIKPSETNVLAETLLKEMIEEYMDPRWVRVVTGGVPETTELLKVRFDHIMYTGNGFVGKIVMKAASQFLTPVTLELGGKNPVIVDKNADLKQAAKRIAAWKIASTGQICLCPDYIMVHEAVEEEFLAHFKKAIDKFLGTPEEEQNKGNGGKIINTRHFDRVAALLKNDHNGEIIRGGLECADRDACFIPLTIVSKPDETSTIKQEEIFGPVVIVSPVKNMDEAIKYVKSKEKPLALYLFSSDSKTINKVVDQTSSGSICINDVIQQNANGHLPFGGVGASGMGAYRGKWGFQEFSHKKAIMYRSRHIDYMGLAEPPFNKLTPVLKTLEKTWY